MDWQAEWEQRLFAWACDQVRQHVTDVTWQAFWRTAIDDRPGQQVAAASIDRTARVWDLASGEARTLTTTTDQALFRTSPDGEICAAPCGPSMRPPV